MSSNFYHTHILPHAAIISKLCQAYTNGQEDYEDYYQEVCLQVWRSHENFKGQSEWSTWVYRVALNVCLTLLRKDKKVSLKYSEHDRLPETLDSDNKNDYNDNDFEKLFQAIRKLKEVDKAIILLYLEEKSYAEIGGVVGLNQNTVGVRITRIKSKLKEMLDGKIN